MERSLKDEDYFEKEGFALWEKGQYFEAAEVFRRGLLEFPNSAWLQVGLGYSYYHCKEYSSAARCFEIALRLDSRHIEAKRGLGLSYIKLNRLTEAHTLHRAILEKLESYPSMMMEVAYNYFLAQDFEEALIYSRKVIAVDSSYCDAYICVAGCLHFLKRDPLEKMEMFTKAADLDCSRYDLLDFFGNVLYDEAHLTEALKVFEKLPVEHLTNPVTVARMIELYKYFQVDAQTIERYEQRLQGLRKRRSIDGLIDSIMEFLGADCGEK